MGIGTRFCDTDLFLSANKKVKNVVVKVTKRYLANHKRAKSDIAADDWLIADDSGPDVVNGDVIRIKPNPKDRRGSANDFIPNLLLLLDAARYYGLEASTGTIPYSTDYGVSGVLRLGEKSVTLTEVYDDDVRIVHFKYLFEDVKLVYAGTFDRYDGHPRTLLEEDD